MENVELLIGLLSVGLAIATIGLICASIALIKMTKANKNEFKCGMIRHHDWLLFSDGTKRKCLQCGDEHWLMMNSYPAVGEPLHEWQDMSNKHLRFT